MRSILVQWSVRRALKLLDVHHSEKAGYALVLQHDVSTALRDSTIFCLTFLFSLTRRARGAIKMKLRLTFFAFFLTSMLQAQTESTFLSFGGSIGNGWAFDCGWGRIEKSGGEIQNGWDIPFSVWSPKWDNGEPKSTQGYFSWFVPTDKTESILAIAVGYRQFFGRLGIGGMLDYVKMREWQNYRSTASNTDWHGPEKSRVEIGGTVLLSYLAGEKFLCNVFAGTERGIMVGLAFWM